MLAVVRNISQVCALLLKCYNTINWTEWNFRLNNFKIIFQFRKLFFFYIYLYEYISSKLHPYSRFILMFLDYTARFQSVWNDSTCTRHGNGEIKNGMRRLCYLYNERFGIKFENRLFLTFYKSFVRNSFIYKSMEPQIYYFHGCCSTFEEQLTQTFRVWTYNKDYSKMYGVNSPHCVYSPQFTI